MCGEHQRWVAECFRDHYLCHVLTTSEECRGTYNDEAYGLNCAEEEVKSS